MDLGVHSPRRMCHLLVAWATFSTENVSLVGCLGYILHGECVTCWLLGVHSPRRMCHLLVAWGTFSTENVSLVGCLGYILHGECVTCWLLLKGTQKETNHVWGSLKECSNLNRQLKAPREAQRRLQMERGWIGTDKENHGGGGILIEEPMGFFRSSVPTAFARDQLHNCRSNPQRMLTTGPLKSKPLPEYIQPPAQGDPQALQHGESEKFHVVLGVGDVDLA